MKCRAHRFTSQKATINRYLWPSFHETAPPFRRRDCALYFVGFRVWAEFVDCRNCLQVRQRGRVIEGTGGASKRGESESSHRQHNHGKRRSIPIPENKTWRIPAQRTTPGLLPVALGHHRRFRATFSQRAAVDDTGRRDLGPYIRRQRRAAGKCGCAGAESLVSTRSSHSNVYSIGNHKRSG